MSVNWLAKRHNTELLQISERNEMLCVFWAFCNYKGPSAPGLNFVKNSLTYFYSLFISSSALHFIAERLASVTADTSFKVFGLTRLRIEPSQPTSKENALNHFAMALVRK